MPWEFFPTAFFCVFKKIFLLLHADVQVSALRSPL